MGKLLDYYKNPVTNPTATNPKPAQAPRTKEEAKACETKTRH